MTSWMDYARNRLTGFGPPVKTAPAVHPVVKRHTENKQPARELLQERLLAERLNVEVEQAEQQRAQVEAERYKKDKTKWMYWRNEEALHKEAEATWRGKMAFTEDQLRLHEGASSNLQHALILKDGKAELDQTVAAIENLDVQDNIDAMHGHAATVAEHDQLFSERLRQPSAERMEATADLDDEWERMQAQAVADSLPMASSGAATKPSAVAPKSDPAAAVNEV